jgi:hypothetical protein
MGELLSTGLNLSRSSLLQRKQTTVLSCLNRLKTSHSTFTLKKNLCFHNYSKWQEEEAGHVFKNKQNESTMIIHYLDNHDDLVYSRIILEPRY